MESPAQESKWPSGKRIECTRITCGLTILVLMTAVYFILSQQGLIPVITDKTALKKMIVSFGEYGPLVVIGLMAGAIMFSTIPSAPIALAAGAAYGHTWGTVYILFGAVAGASGAFTIARLLGFDIVHRLLGERILSKPMLGSQTALMGILCCPD